MRSGFYRAATIVAWPAAAWFAMEAALRAATADLGGALLSLAWATLAAFMIAASRLRLAQLPGR